MEADQMFAAVAGKMRAAGKTQCRDCHPEVARRAPVDEYRRCRAVRLDSVQALSVQRSLCIQSPPPE
ncbi:hypothetical protein G3N58_10685 [Paraburkholderia sp. Ac-20342]|uniref:hypothetical protein n=1 Tax=Paraburkholderia sp. Ac-20342 TaxID=2703889 RepID=UPI00197DE063|nr:hypothetical protein [Paraburkholderia sp. Ac-20342]MBN3847291.1 hypothetical protein [Paraburkholderia sp. Ac-20342]